MTLSTMTESRSEKKARAAFLSAVIRSLHKDRIVICDGMNYLKSLRYQVGSLKKEEKGVNNDLTNGILLL
jgi:tRNA uridine 5-carbamoylmethylation protein Kti12